LAGATAVTAATIDIEITNATHNIYFTPLLATAHPDGDDPFQPGVVSSNDGLAGSALNKTHRFQNPVARLAVMRID
jgi:hypothetical protein